MLKNKKQLIHNKLFFTSRFALVWYTFNMKIYSLLHINIQKEKHIEKIRNCIREHKPDFICMQEVLENDIISFSKEFGYYYVHAPKFISKHTHQAEGQGMLSKYPLLNIKKQRYDINKSKKTPLFNIFSIFKNSKKRPQEQFLFHEILLSAEVILDLKTVTIATTHFPVSDHTTPGLNEHELQDIESLHYLQGVRGYFDRFLKKLKKLKKPLIFTSDLNNPRGEYIYNKLAHELIDHIPLTLDSSIDSTLHRVKNLKLMVDTIMTSEEIHVYNINVIEGISDHKGFLMSFDLQQNL